MIVLWSRYPSNGIISVKCLRTKSVLITYDTPKNTVAIEQRFVSIVSQDHRSWFMLLRSSIQFKTVPSSLRVSPSHFNRMHPMALTYLAYGSISIVFVIKCTKSRHGVMHTRNLYDRYRWIVNKTLMQEIQWRKTICGWVVNKKQFAAVFERLQSEARFAL